MPCNQFGGQEPGTAEEIAEFCSATYGVTFPMTEKVDVNGAGRHPVYDELVQVADQDGQARRHRSGTSRSSCSTGPGTVVARFDPTVVPDDPRVTGGDRVRAGLTAAVRWSDGPASSGIACAPVPELLRVSR